jgi:hypothetical protein
MPQPTDDLHDPIPEGYRYRVTTFAADDVIPPLVPGWEMSSALCGKRELADQEIEVAVARADLGRILLEERLAGDGAGHANEWCVIHSWKRTTEGWRHQ